MVFRARSWFLLLSALGACSGKTISVAPGPTGGAVAMTRGGAAAAATAGSGDTMSDGGVGGAAVVGGYRGVGGAAAAGGRGGGTATGGAASGGKCGRDVPDVCGTGVAAVCTLKVADPQNCGVCGRACAAGAVCAAGDCGPQPDDVGTAAGCGGGVRMALHGANLYWTERLTGKVRTMPVAGGAIADVATGQLSPTQIAVDDRGVYWENQGDATASSSKLLMKPLPLSAGAPLVLLSAAAEDKLPALGLRGGKLYYALHSELHQLTLNQAGDTVSADIMVGIAVNYDNPQNPWVIGEAQGLAVSDTHVVWSTPDDRNSVESHTLMPVTNAADNLAGYGKLAKGAGSLLPSGDVGIDDQYGYWADGERFNRNVLTDKNGAAQTITVAPDSTRITAFTLNATKFYAAAENGQIFSHSLLPSANPNDDTITVLPVLMARDQQHVTSMLVDATTLYWVTSDCVIRSQGL